MSNSDDPLPAPGHSRRVLESVAWGNIDRVLRLAFGLVQTAWLARQLGPEGFGILSSGLALVALVAGPASLGLDSILVRRLVVNLKHGDSWLRVAFRARAVSSFVSVIAVVTWAQLAAASSEERTVLSVLAVSALAPAIGTFDAWFKAQTLHKFVIWCQLAAFVTAFAVRMVLLSVGAPLLTFAAVAVFEVILGAGLVGLCYLKSRKPLKPDVHVSGIGDLLGESWPLIVSGVAVALCARFDLVAVSRLLGADEAGRYAAAVRLSELFNFTAVALVAACTPRLIAVRERDQTLFSSEYSTLLGFLGWCGLVLSVGLVFGASLLVNLVYGDAYSESAGVLRVLCWVNVFVFLGTGWSVFWLVERLQWISMLVTIGGAIAGVTLNLLLIPSIGMKGAAIASLIAHVLPFVLLLLFRSARGNAALMLRGLLHPGKALAFAIGILRTPARVTQ